MTQKEFWEALGHTKNWQIINSGFAILIRNKKCCACPIAYIANKKKKKVGYFRNINAMSAAKYLGLNQKFARNVIRAADYNLDMDNNPIYPDVMPIRNKLMKVCGLK